MSTEIFTEIRQANDLVEQLATRTQLEDDEVMLAGFGKVDEANNIGMIQLSHDLNLFQDVGSLMPC